MGKPKAAGGAEGLEGRQRARDDGFDGALLPLQREQRLFCFLQSHGKSLHISRVARRLGVERLFCSVFLKLCEPHLSAQRVESVLLFRHERPAGAHIVPIDPL